jgi:hypothetical protein
VNAGLGYRLGFFMVGGEMLPVAGEQVCECSLASPDRIFRIGVAGRCLDGMECVRWGDRLVIEKFLVKGLTLVAVNWQHATLIFVSTVQQ